ncbi:MAG: quinolinate synthase NadA [Terriglobia bacterium]
MNDSGNSHLDKLADDIRALKAERRAVILAHNYQRPEVQDVADFTGDSLGLSQEAAGTDADVIIFCGVHFMAETAYVLSPQKTVILPDLRAGCPLADTIKASDVRDLRAAHPGAPVVSYVNTSAAVKAESDLCCTSANAIQVVESLPDRKVIFVPDENLGRYVQKHTDKEIVIWPGTCVTHHRILAESILRLKAEHPQAVFMAHPECTPDVVDLADEVASTSGMIRLASRLGSEEFIVGTEVGMLYPLKRANPGKRFYPVPEALCPNMKRINLNKVFISLRDLEPKITVPEETRLAALKAVKKMIAIT